MTIDITRREFVVASAAVALFRWTPRDDVTIVQFSDAGKKLGDVRVPKVVKSEGEWRKQLSGESFHITRQAGTERAFSGAYWNLHDKGIFRCICCDTALFSSSAKFDSGTGWPSFFVPADADAVDTAKDWKLLIPRTEVRCNRCGGHLGHVFNDGPRPTGKRYCINSCALKLDKS
jgi:peptide-methionine (R)-S-oxide reductase